MKIRHLQSLELLILTGMCMLATIIALFLGKEHVDLLIILTLLMAVMAFIARYRHRREVKTLQGKGRRRYGK